MQDEEATEANPIAGGREPARGRFDIRFPAADKDSLDQDEEWCEVVIDGAVRRFRFHDYAESYSVPGLYEQLFYDELKCQSPQVVCGLLIEKVREGGGDPADLVVFDVGAGNGMAGEELARHGVRTIVGNDIIEEAKQAVERDRPGLYEDYFVLDLTDMPPEDRAALEAKGFNCLTVVAALGFEDIPPLAFAEAYNLVSEEGWVAFNIKEDFLSAEDRTGFSQLIEMMLEEGTLERRGERRYRHRYSSAGEPLHYVAIVARKRRDVPLEWTEGLNA